MPRGPRIQWVRKALSFVTGDLLAGEIGVNTTSKRLTFSTDGADVISIPKGYELLIYDGSNYPAKAPGSENAIYFGPVSPASKGITMGAQDYWRNPNALGQLSFLFFGPIAQKFQFAVPMTVQSPQLGYTGNTAPTVVYSRSTSYMGTYTNISSWPASFDVGDVLQINPTNFADSTELLVTAARS